MESRRLNSIWIQKKHRKSNKNNRANGEDKMISGRAENDSEKIAKIKAVLRKLHPDIGFIKIDDHECELQLSGKNIAALGEDIETLKTIENILLMNKFGTSAILEIKERAIAAESGRRSDKICVIA